MAKIGCSLWSTGSWTQSGRRQADLVSATSYHDRRPLARSPSLGKPRTKTSGTLWRPAIRRHATCCSALHVPIKLTICSVIKSRIPFKLSSSSFMPLLWWYVFSSISLFAILVIQPLAVNAAQVEIPPNTSQDGFANHFPSNCDLASWCNPVWQQETAGKSSPHLGRTWAKAILKVEGRVEPTGNVFVAGLLAPLGDRIWVGTERFAAVGEGCFSFSWMICSVLSLSLVQLPVFRWTLCVVCAR